MNNLFNYFIILKYKRIKEKNGEQFESFEKKEISAQVIFEEKFVKIICNYDKEINFKKCKISIYNSEKIFLNQLQPKKIIINFDKCILICRKEIL